MFATQKYQPIFVSKLLMNFSKVYHLPRLLFFIIIYFKKTKRDIFIMKKQKQNQNQSVKMSI